MYCTLWQLAYEYYCWQQADRPFVRERDPTRTRQSRTECNIWSWAPNGAWHQDRLTDWPSVACDFDFERVSGVQWVSVSCCGELLRFSPFELLLLQAGRRGTGIVPEPRVDGLYQATAREDWEHFMCAVVIVIFAACNSVRLIYVL
jgi:hypothetical protein